MPESAKRLHTPSSLALTEYLANRIRSCGPITFREWMEAALYHPTEGYYVRSDRPRWGREGDYRTSPERTELFAGTFARYLAALHDKLGRPDPWTIIESGSGDGSFAQGLLSSLQDYFPQIACAVHYVVDEVSEDARRLVAQRVGAFGDRVRFASLHDLEPVDRGVFFSNELLDSFPVHRLTLRAQKLCELYVTLTRSGKFAFVANELSTPRLGAFCKKYEIQLTEGQVIEVNLGIEEWLEKTATKLTAGFVITIDYGAEAEELYSHQRRPQGSLRAYSRHRFVDDVLAAPGEYDITSSVNWTQVRTVSSRLGLELVEFSELDKFLLRAGLLEELQRRLENATSESEKLRLSTTAREMILPGGMASCFSVLVLKRRCDLNAAAGQT